MCGQPSLQDLWRITPLLVLRTLCGLQGSFQDRRNSRHTTKGKAVTPRSLVRAHAFRVLKTYTPSTYTSPACPRYYPTFSHCLGCVLHVLCGQLP